MHISVKHTDVGERERKGVRERPHHEILYTDAEGNTLLVKMFHNRQLDILMQGNFNITADEMGELARHPDYVRGKCPHLNTQERV